jgi:hypothetical protein
MEKEFVSYEQALALKVLRFNEICLAYWYNETPTNPMGQCIVYYKKPYDDDKIINGIIRDYYWAPLKQQVFRWFREKYKLEGIVEKSDGFTWYRFNCYLYDEDTEAKLYLIDGFEFTTYEEAENACIDKLIELAKQQDK